MIVVIEPYNYSKYPALIEKMFRLRARVFHDRLKWDVRIENGEERDKYDTVDPVYVIYTDDQFREIRGSLRLLPTTGPTLLRDVFAESIPESTEICAPTIWECTRLCLNDHLVTGGTRDEIILTSTVLLVALGEVAMAAGIETILANLDSSMIRLYRQIGCEFEILGSTDKFAHKIYLAAFQISHGIVGKLKRKLRENQRLLGRFENTRILAA